MLNEILKKLQSQHYSVIFFAQLIVLIFLLLQSAAKFQNATTETLPFNDSGFLDMCPNPDAPFSKFLWLFFDGLATDQSPAVRDVFLKDSAEHTSWFTFWNSGMANSANVYTSYFSGKTLGNIVGAFIESDTIFRSMKRAKMDVAYIGWSTPLVEMLNPADEVFKEWVDHPFSYSIMPLLFGEKDSKSDPTRVNDFLNAIKSKDESALVITGITDKMNHWFTKTGAGTTELIAKLAKDMAYIKAWVDQNPEYLLIISSDHGGDRYEGESVRRLHGPPDGGNEPFTLYYNPSLHSSANGELVDVTDFTPTFTQYFKNTNIPAENVGRVHPWTEDPQKKAHAYICNAAQLYHLLIARGSETPTIANYHRGVEAFNNKDYETANTEFEIFVNDVHYLLDGLRSPYFGWYLFEMGLAFAAVVWILSTIVTRPLSVPTLIECLKDIPFMLSAVMFAFFFITNNFLPAFEQERLATQYLAYTLLFFALMMYLDPENPHGASVLKVITIFSIILLISNIVHAPRLIVCASSLYQLFEYGVLLFYLFYDINMCRKKGLGSSPLTTFGFGAVLILLHFAENFLHIPNALYVSYHLCFIWLFIGLLGAPSLKMTLLYPVAYLLFALESVCFTSSFTIFALFPFVYWFGMTLFKNHSDKDRHKVVSIWRLNIVLTTCLLYCFNLWIYLYMDKTISIDVDPDIPGIADQVAMYLRAGFLIGFHKAGSIILTSLMIYRFALLNTNHPAAPPSASGDNFPPLLVERATPAFSLSKETMIIWQFTFSIALFYLALFEENFFYKRHFMTFFTLAMMHTTMALTLGALLIPTDYYLLKIRQFFF